MLPSIFHSEPDNTVEWQRTYSPRELYRVEYADRNGEYSERTIEVTQFGCQEGHWYFGAFEGRPFKTFRAERILKMQPLGSASTALEAWEFALRQPPAPEPVRVSGEHKKKTRTEIPPEQVAAKRTVYKNRLPAWSVAEHVIKVPALVGTRRWTVNLSLYTCSCPEGRMRKDLGYDPGSFGGVCPHLARGIIEQMPPNVDWSPEILAFLQSEAVLIGNLI